MKNKLLIIDDDLRMRQLLEEKFKKHGYSVISTVDSRDALMIISDEPFDAVVTDLKMPHIEGMEILEFSKQKDPDVPVIVITGYGTVDSAIDAMKKGAYDYLQKPFDPEELLLIVKRAIEHYQLIKRNRALSETIETLRADELIGSSQSMREVKALIKKVASLDITVLIQGETGTGKEIAARLIHKSSLRADKSFLPVNCGAIAETILESELFGHERGAFTGADHTKKGLLESADSGSLFLDEINSMSPALQVKVLRFLQDKTYLKVGGTEVKKADVRIIAASNSNLKDEVESHRFREDLYYRLNMFIINLPPLSRRKEDIPELSYHFLRKYTNKYEKKLNVISDEAMKLLADYPWPGNVRELENTIERAIIVETEKALTAKSLHDDILRRKTSNPLDSLGLISIGEMEIYLIKRALRETGNNKTQAAKVLGIDQSTLWRKIKGYGI